MLENLTQGLKAPCVMDVKIGARTYGPDATEAKMKQEDAKYLGTKVVVFFENHGIFMISFLGASRLQCAGDHQPQ